MTKSIHKAIKSSSGSFSAVAALLLVIYFVVFVISPLGLPHLHHDDEALHGDACFAEPCHIAIFHPGAKGACNHKFHFTQAAEECSFCQILPPRQIVSPLIALSDIHLQFACELPEQIWSFSKLLVLCHSDRGPPC